MNFNYSLYYNSSIWKPVTTSGTTVWTPEPHWGWAQDTSGFTGILNVSTDTSGICPSTNATLTEQSNFSYKDVDG